jgi:hypothetical protein
MKVKVIDLLNKIARGEEPPKKIIYEDYIFEYKELSYDYQNENGVWLFEDICFDGENHLNKEVEILETTITYKQDNIENNKQEPMFKKINGEWYANKDLVEWLDKNYEPIKFKNIDGIYIEKKNKIEKINIYKSLSDDFNKD